MSYKYSLIENCRCVPYKYPSHLPLALETYDEEEIQILLEKEQIIETRIYSYLCCLWTTKKFIHCRKCRCFDEEIHYESYSSF